MAQGDRSFRRVRTSFILSIPVLVYGAVKSVKGSNRRQSPGIFSHDQSSGHLTTSMVDSCPSSSTFRGVLSQPTPASQRPKSQPATLVQMAAPTKPSLRHHENYYYIHQLYSSITVVNSIRDWPACIDPHVGLERNGGRRSCTVRNLSVFQSSIAVFSQQHWA